MELLSAVFQPVVTAPREAAANHSEIACKSQRLLVETGLVRARGAGLVALLPLGLRALRKLEALVEAAVRGAGGQRLSLPALQPAASWRASGRLAAAGAELLRLTDRRDKDYLLAPTHEESIADLLADVGPLSHRQLPLLLYQMSEKYRDERRPRHGLLRARAFRMMDAYGLHAAPACAAARYAAAADAYAALFRRLRLPVHRVEASAGDMGGSLSHEWQLAVGAAGEGAGAGEGAAGEGAGEDAVAVCVDCGAAALAAPAAPAATCPRCGGHALTTHRSIEVGHTFVLGARYSAPLGAHFVPAAGAARPLLMTCYGIGLTRLLAGCVEALSSETALRWPEEIAPYHTLIIPPKEGSREAEAAGERLRGVHDAMTSRGRDVLVDDRTHLTVGKRLRAADKMGYPCVVVLGRSSAGAAPRYELHRPGAEPALLALEQLAAAAHSEPLPRQVPLPINIPVSSYSITFIPNSTIYNTMMYAM